MKIKLTLIILIISQLSLAENIIVDGNTCTLGDAIEAANTDMTTIGGCVDSSAGADTLILNSGFSALVADTVRSSFEYGSYAALPDVTTVITIQAGLEGFIKRDDSLECKITDGSDEFRLLQVLGSGHLTLDGITLSSGCSNSGGALLVVNSEISVQSSIFFNNYVSLNTVGNGDDQSGGAIAIYGNSSNATIIDSVFDSNNSFSSTSLNPQGGAIKVMQANNLTIQNTSFINNITRSNASSSLGGALFINEVASVQIEGGIYRNNLAKGRLSSKGGAIYFGNNTIDLIMSGTTFENNMNIATSGISLGGAVFLNTATALLEDLIFTQNLVQSGSSGQASAGAIYLESAAIINNSFFTKNQSIAGAGQNANAGALLIAISATLENVTFFENSVEAGSSDSSNGNNAFGGAISSCELTATNITISNNIIIGGNSTFNEGGNGFGGGLYSDCGPSNLIHSTIVGNQIIAGNGNTAQGDGYGAGLYIEGGYNISNSIIQNNSKIIGMVSSASDCEGAGTSVTSLGYNHIGNSINCNFMAIGDQLAMNAEVYPLTDNGCKDLLPDGTCLPTHAIDFNSSALDQGSCTVSGVNTDARGKVRPYDDLNVSNADDGCDVGAFEYDHDLIFKNGFENPKSRYRKHDYSTTP